MLGTISATLYLSHISPISPPYLAHISPISRPGTISAALAARAVGPRMLGNRAHQAGAKPDPYPYP